MRVSKQLGELIVRIKGEDSFGQMSMKTRLSKAYLVEIAAGKVPSLQVLQQILSAYHAGAEMIRRVYEATGYPLPDSFRPDITQADQVRESVAEYLVEKKGMSEDEVKEMFDEIG